jgi:3-oxoacyl-[acyl-carrier-protein] synthase II
VLVGGSYNAERPDSLLIYAMGGFLWRKPFRPVFERPNAGGGFILGSGGAFVVLESREHAEARGARALASLAAVASARTRRAPGAVSSSLAALWREAGLERPDLVVSGATGVAMPTVEERDALQELARDVVPLATGDALGHTIEMHAPAGVALAAALIARDGAQEAAVTAIGHWRGEGVIRLTRA